LARSKAKLWFASAGGKPELAISNADWQRIEAAYGHQLSETLRRQIHEKTNEFLWWAGFEHTARAVSEAVETAQQYKKAAQDVRRVFFRRSTDPDILVQRLICKYQGLRWEKGRIGLQNLVLNFERIVSQGCDRAIAELRASKSGFRAGEMWDGWVRSLSRILNAKRLPTQARKDTDKQTKSSSSSPFIGFLRELQQCIPPKFRRSTQSDAALAQAIYKARRAPRREPKRSQGPRNRSRREPKRFQRAPE
jgi:hypothetical protein